MFECWWANCLLSCFWGITAQPPTQTLDCWMAPFCVCCTTNILLKLISHFSNSYWFLYWKVLTCVRTPQRQFLIFFNRLSKQVFLILGLRRVNLSISSHLIRETTLIFQTNWFVSFPYVCFTRKCFLVFGTSKNKVKRKGFCNGKQVQHCEKHFPL